MKIAICDDDIRQLDNLKAQIEAYRTVEGTVVSYDAYNSGVELLSNLDKNYDALILDILMPGFTGMDVAKALREENNNMKIVFLTSSPEFALEGYSVQAFDYVMKPAKQSQVSKVLDRLYESMEHNDKVLTINTPKRIINVAYSQIDFIEVSNRTILIHLANGECEEFTGHLQDIEGNILNEKNFIKTHRAYIANMRRVKSINQGEFVTMRNEIVPISRGVFKDVKETYLDFILG